MSSSMMKKYDIKTIKTAYETTVRLISTTNDYESNNKNLETV